MNNSDYLQNYLDFFHPQQKKSLQQAMQSFSELQHSFQSILEMNQTIDKLYQNLMKEHS